MKSNTTTLILGVALTVVAGLFSSTIFGFIDTKTDTSSTASATGLISGHVTTIHKDSVGNVIAYRQSDNIIVNSGENCVLKMLFSPNGGESTGTSVCVGANTDGYRFIGIGNGTSTAVASDLKLGNPHNTTSFGSTSTLVRKAATTTTYTNSTGTDTEARIVLSATFTNNAAGSQTVTESGLFNLTDTDISADGLFARQTFTSITLNNGDSLTVQWTVDVGGTGTFN